ncbi:MAG: DinB family protein, partial [Acidobacteriota bacterium]
MKTYSMIVSFLLTVPGTFAQAPNPFISDLKHFYAVRKGDLLKAVDRMPAEDYGFKPTPDMRSFGQLVAHIADA